jgi:hypothetical protein
MWWGANPRWIAGSTLILKKIIYRLYKFVKDVRELSRRGVQTDLTKRSNLFYDKQSGFSFIDIEGISIDGSATKKFFKKGGVEYYYAFERYPYFEKVFKGGKDMFMNIPI